MSLALSYALRDLRGGLQGLIVFLVCLALGVAAIAGIGTTRAAISTALSEQGGLLLGGDAEMRWTYREANAEELTFMESAAREISLVYDFRSLARTVGDDPDQALTQLLAVDDAYPLIGAVELAPPMPIAEALAGDGVVMERALADRLGLRVGDVFKLGAKEFRLGAILLTYPDSAGADFSLGPRSIVLREALVGSGLLAEGTLFETRYRMMVREGQDLAALEEAAEAFPAARWTDARNGTPNIRVFVNRLGDFLVLLGLAGLAVGGVGIAAATRGHLERKTGTIATLRSLGASRAQVMWCFGFQIIAIGLVGLGIGLILGAGLPLLFAPLIEARLPLPVDVRLYGEPLLEAALYGALTAGIFALWPLSQAEAIRPAALFREAKLGQTGLPRIGYLIAIALMIAALAWAAIAMTDRREVAAWTLAGIAVALGALALAALAIRWIARRLARLRWPPALRLALASVGGPGSAAVATVLSVGLGLTVLATIGQIDGTIRGDISGRLPEVAPSYFIVDIQPDQVEGVRARFDEDPGVSDYRTAPMLRGIITQINGQPARDVAGDHWVLNGDRGITYASTNEGGRVTDGAFWPADYNGPPQISFAAEEAEEMGLSLGDTMTVEILGRAITGEITSFRDVDFSEAGMGFILAMPTSTLAGAPHSHIATVYAEREAEGPLARDLARAYPNITAIASRDALARVEEFLGSIATATRWGAAASLITGLFVLIGTAAARARAQATEAAILKTLGASRAQVRRSFLWRAAILGGAAGAVALFAGAAGAWALLDYRFELDYTLLWGPAFVVIGLGIGVTLLAGAIFARAALQARPAHVLRTQE